MPLYLLFWIGYATMGIATAIYVPSWMRKTVQQAKDAGYEDQLPDSAQQTVDHLDKSATAVLFVGVLWPVFVFVIIVTALSRRD